MIVPLTFSTARLQLRLPKLSDAAAVFEYASDPLVTRFMDWPAAVEPADSLRATERALEKWASAEEYGWRIVVPPSDVPIGSIGCRVRGEMADFGFVLNRHHWGRGYATEAASAMLEWLKALDVIRGLHATCDIENVASMRVLEKLGLSQVARLPAFVARPNMPGAPTRDAWLYSWSRAPSAPSQQR